MINFSDIPHIYVIIVLWIGLIAFSITNIYRTRFELLITHYVETGVFKPTDSVFRAFIKSLRSFASLRKYPPPHYDLFVSYKSDPDKELARYIASALNGYYRIAFIEKNLDDEPLSASMGKLPSISAHIREKLSKSSFVVIIYSDESFSSNWVAREFNLAMKSADLVLFLNKSTMDSDIIKRKINGFLNRITMNAPTYIKNIGDATIENVDTRILELGALLKSISNRNKFFLDVSSLITNHIVTALFFFLGFYFKLEINKIVFGFILFSISFICALIYPCRPKPDKEMLRFLGFKKIYPGWKLDMYRIQETILATIFGYLLAFVARDSFVAMAFVALLMSPSSFILIHDLLQVRAIQK